MTVQPTPLSLCAPRKHTAAHPPGRPSPCPRWLAGVLVACGFSLGAGSARAQAAGAMDFLFGTGVPRAADVTAAAPRVWKLGEYSAIALQPREAGSPPNQHPATLAPDALRTRLAAVEFTASNGRVLPLFAADEAADLATALARAFAAAGPGDDLLLFATARRESGFLGLPLSVMARLFVADGELQLIVDSTRSDTLGMFRAARIVPTLGFGQRARASAAKVGSAQASTRRADWLAFAVAGGQAVPAATLSAPPPNPGGTSRAAAASPPAAAPARVRDERFYEEQSQRLKGLQRLREQGLLSEAEYQQARREILQSL